MNRIAWLYVLAVVHLLTVTDRSAAADAAPVAFGAVGDSLTDEYSVWSPFLYQSDSALNWVDLLGTQRTDEVNFGTFDAWDPVEFPGGPRYVGYEYNYARLGATTNTMLAEGQHTGVASQPVSFVFLGIGTNDFSAIDESLLGLTNQYGGIYSGADPTSIINNLVANFTTALDTIAGPADNPMGVHVIVGNVGDWGVLPRAHAAGYTNPALQANVTNAIVEANEQLGAIALARGIPVVDVFGLLNLQAKPDPVVIGGVTLIDGSHPSDDQHYFTLPDSIHPGTLAQGLLANAIITAANVGYGTELTPFSDQELLAAAGIADPNGGSLTSYYSVDRFVEAVPEPSTLVLAAIGAVAAMIVRKRRRLVVATLSTSVLALFASSAFAVDIATVKVGNPGNAPDQYYFSNNETKLQFGTVNYNYRMGSYEVTNDQYAEFLNAVGAVKASDLGLYSTQMNASLEGGITFTNSNGHITFASKPEMGNKPVTFVGYVGAYRFSNWLNNGQGSGDTEHGAYTFSPNMSLNQSVARNANARWFLPSENEWYKAAYYDQSLNSGAGGYWLYPMRSNSQPTSAHVDSLGNISNPGANVANYSNTAQWSGHHETTVGSAGLLSQSYYGTSDQGGNLREYTDTLYESDTLWHIYRGGSWNSGANASDMKASDRSVWASTIGSQGPLGFGFRVATILPEVAGDINWDDVVDGADYTTWADHFLTTVQNWTTGDLNGDGLVDGSDYTVWADHFAPSVSPISTSAVPEPSTLILAVVGIVGLVLGRSCRRWIPGLIAGVVVIANCDVDALAVDIATVKVGNPGNAPDQLYTDTYNNPENLRFGSVPYNYRIGTYEVTNDQYAEFLNAKASGDPTLGLYSGSMGRDGGITRTTSGSSYQYAVKPQMGNKPVNYVNWYSAIRFANWLNNGQGTSDTETGAYTLLGGTVTGTPTNGPSITRNPAAAWFLPSEDEWYKAAYYDPTVNNSTGGYWLYPTRSNSKPTLAHANSVGDISNPGANVANFGGAHWNLNLSAQFTTVGSAGSESQSFYGTSDQGGNVWEYNETSLLGDSRGFRGGSSTYGDGMAASHRDWTSVLNGGLNSLGFRVATILPAVAGDINWDNVVDGADYTTWADHFLSTVQNWTAGDLTGDGLVDGADYTIWADHFSPTASPAFVATVPEPSSFCYAAFGIVGLVLGRCRRSLILGSIACLAIAQCRADARAVEIPTVKVGDAGNAADSTGYGAVPYNYRIGTYEVTNQQYAEFLNAKAASDPLGLFDTNMSNSAYGGITRTGGSGSFTYSVKPGFSNRPVDYVSWYDSVRYVNWLNNGRGGGDTESGAYTISGGKAAPTNGQTIARNAGATWALPSEDEWYKSAYFSRTDSTYKWFPYGTNDEPVAEAPPGGTNSANFSLAVGTMTNVGAYTNSIGPYGTYDEGGNVWEWNEEPYFSGANRGLRGGGAGPNFSVDSLASFWHTPWDVAANNYIDVGFRVVNLRPYLPGDGNWDNTVDGADYTVWADHFLQTGQTWATGDFNHDGVVDGADYTIWADHFAPATSSTILNSAVPEPSTLSLAALAIMGLILWRRRLNLLPGVVAAVAIVNCGTDALAIDIATVKVGNPGNAPDQYYPLDNPSSLQFGAVGYNYRIATYEVTNAQYVEFLNAKGGTDSLGLYATQMSGLRGGITRSGSNGNYSYAVKPDMGNKPVNWVSWYDTIRFANWLNNGQGNGDTETGAYTLGALDSFGAPVNVNTLARNPGAAWFLTSENEWYKAAYYDPTLNSGTGGYWNYPTRSNSLPTVATANSVGDISNPGPNVVNYLNNAHWPVANKNDGNVTTVGSAGPLSKSFYGTYDQGGNVFEWNDSIELADPTNSRGLRGGGWQGDSGDLQAWHRTGATPGSTNTYRDNRVGFRVATILPAVTGDINWDNLVDGADYTTWADHFLSTVQNWTAGDLNGDGLVDGADYTIWADHFAPATSSTILNSAVPEPSTLSLAALAIMGLILWRRRLNLLPGVVAGMAIANCSVNVLAVEIATVTVGNRGNAPDQFYPQDNSAGLQFGAVSYNYRIGTYEVTNNQYAEFLNAKAKDDPLKLFSPGADGDPRFGITRNGLDGNYTYAVKPNMGNKPVNNINWYDSVRFANWLNNGQGAGDTETGAYTIGEVDSSGIPLDIFRPISRNATAAWFVPSEDEWYKAAYYDPTLNSNAGGYWLYPTQSNIFPTWARADSTGNISNPGPNVINFQSFADWNGLNGNFTTVGSAGPSSQSHYGTYDQGGNAWEWNESVMSPGDWFHIVRGGSYLNFGDSSKALYRDGADPRSLLGLTVGFRVATILPAVTGDINWDNLVDGADYTTWADHFLSTVQNWTAGDLNGDGVVDGADYTIWADHFAPATASVLASTVPEPSTFVLGAIGLLAFAAGRRLIDCRWHRASNKFEIARRRC